MNTDPTNVVYINGTAVPFTGERNLLELVRKANVELPTFCYHSELSVYGACRLCLVDIDGRGIQASCSTAPEPGLRLRTHTEELREIRKINIELLLASHHGGCTTCGKSRACKLLDLARRIGVDTVRFTARRPALPRDESNPSLVRDPNKCVLCGDCVRFCSEIQGIGAIDFARRGAATTVCPAFDKKLGDVECVFCGQCARVCPTGAIMPRPETEPVWKAIQDPEKKVVAQLAPAVRVALGEAFGLEPGEDSTGRITAALRAIGFDFVFDTSFAADLTVIEEATEFLHRAGNGGKLPQFTSCCPAWVRYAEQFYPDLLPHLSSCRSPQQMFGALTKKYATELLQVPAAQLTIVSIMPCTAKKYEARRPEFKGETGPDVDYVLTTQELIRMIETAGIKFPALKPQAMDMPLGFKTGAGVIFGNSGGVSEAVLRYAWAELAPAGTPLPELRGLRSADGRRTLELEVGGKKLKLVIVHGLANAKILAEQVRAGSCDADLIEIMACPGGCIGGAGQPVTCDLAVRQARTDGLYAAETVLQLTRAQDNPFVREIYEKHLGTVGGDTAHTLLHTHYHSRRRIQDNGLALNSPGSAEQLPVAVCVGTSCFLRGSQELLRDLLAWVDRSGLQERVAIKATFCHERCARGPTVMVGDAVLEKTALAGVQAAVTAALAAVPAVAEVAS